MSVSYLKKELTNNLYRAVLKIKDYDEPQSDHGILRETLQGLSLDYTFTGYGIRNA